MAREQLLKATVEGDEQIRAALRAISGRVSSRVIKGAMSKTSQTVIAAIRATAPMSRGREAAYRRAHGKARLIDTLAVSFSGKGGYVTRARIGPSYPSGAHGHLSEFGTVDRYAIQRDIFGEKVVFSHERTFVANPLSKHGRGWWRGRTVYQYDHRLYRGRMRAQHWMLRAWQQVGGRALEELKAHIAMGILQEAARLRRETGRKLNAAGIRSEAADAVSAIGGAP